MDQSTRNIKILHLSAVNSWGGGENHIENLCFELKRNVEVENTILCVKNKPFHKKIKKGDFRVQAAPLFTKLDPRYILKVIKVCEQEKFDLIHIHDPTALTLAVFADQFADLPPFVFSKKISFPVRKRKRTLYKYNYPKIAKYLCVSEQTKQVMAEAIEDKNKLITIYHGTRIDIKSSETPFKLREKLHIPPQKIIVGNIANHHFSKSLETFIDVADYLINKLGLEDFIFIQIGTFTKLTDALLQRIKDKKLDEHVKFQGYIPNASNFIPQFDISLITSTNEGLPQVIYESFYHKVPIVSTKVAGIPEVIQHGKNGFLAEKKDVKALGDNLIFLKKNPELCEKFVEINFPLVLENFSTKQMAEKTLNEYKKIIYG